MTYRMDRESSGAIYCQQCNGEGIRKIEYGYFAPKKGRLSDLIWIQGEICIVCNCEIPPEGANIHTVI